MYRLELTGRARKSLNGLRRPDRKAVDGALAQLEINPKDLKFWTSSRDADAMCIFAGPKNEWKITFTVIDEARMVYVHAIRRRPSFAFDPRSDED